MVPYWALFLPTRLHASGNRCLVKNANWILHINVQSAVRIGSGAHKKRKHTDWCHPEGSRSELNSPRSSHASTERPFVEFANWILLHFVCRTASSTRIARTKKDRHPFGCLSFFGGATQIRTGGRGVADLCLTTWPWRHI